MTQAKLTDLALWIGIELLAATIFTMTFWLAGALFQHPPPWPVAIAVGAAASWFYLAWATKQPPPTRRQPDEDDMPELLGTRFHPDGEM